MSGKPGIIDIRYRIVASYRAVVGTYPDTSACVVHVQVGECIIWLAVELDTISRIIESIIVYRSVLAYVKYGKVGRTVSDERTGCAEAESVNPHGCPGVGTDVIPDIASGLRAVELDIG